MAPVTGGRQVSNGDGRRRRHPSRGDRQSGFSVLELLMVVGVLGVITAITAPAWTTMVAGMRLSGDARSVSDAVALAKIQASSGFTRARVFVDLDGRTYQIQRWDKTASAWTTVGGQSSLSTSSLFSFGTVATPPPNTQGTIGQAPQCVDNAGNAIGNSACITFNSRGLPIDTLAAITPNDALYVTDGSAVYGITVAPTGMIRMWRTPPVSSPAWSLQ